MSTAWTAQRPDPNTGKPSDAADLFIGDYPTFPSPMNGLIDELQIYISGR